MIPWTSWNYFYVSSWCFEWWLEEKNLQLQPLLPASQGQWERQICLAARFGFVHYIICVILLKTKTKLVGNIYGKSLQITDYRKTNLTLTLPMARGLESWDCKVFSSHTPKHELKNIIWGGPGNHVWTHMILTRSGKWGPEGPAPTF